MSEKQEKQEEQKGAGQNPVEQKAPEQKKAEQSSKPEKELTRIERFKKLATGKGKKKKVEFIASPTGLLNLGYHIGDKVSFEEKQVEMLLELGLAKVVK